MKFIFKKIVSVTFYIILISIAIRFATNYMNDDIKWYTALFVIFFFFALLIATTIELSIEIYKIIIFEKQFSLLKYIDLCTSPLGKALFFALFSLFIWTFNIYIQDISTNFLVFAILLIPQLAKKDNKNVINDLFKILFLYFLISIFLKELSSEEIKEPFNKFLYFSLKNMKVWTISKFSKDIFTLSFLKAFLFAKFYTLLIKMLYNTSKIIFKEEKKINKI